MVFKKIFVVFIFACMASSLFAQDKLFTVSNKLSKEEQEKLALQLYKDMVALDNNAIVEIEKLHTEVIEKCSKTQRAEESLWKLSPLYIVGPYPPNFYSAIGVLEYLVDTYPESGFMDMAKSRLLTCYEETGQYDKVCNLYADLFEADPNPPLKTYIARALSYARALDKVGNTENAEEWYKLIIEKDNGQNSIEARAAKRRLGL